MESITLIPINELLHHEEIAEERVVEIQRSIIEKNAFTEAILVDIDSKVILDGHHRTTALKRLGAKFVPAVCVDYHGKEIQVYKRREDSEVSKEIVLRNALKKKLFPPKTTRHKYKVNCSANYELIKLLPRPF